MAYLSVLASHSLLTACGRVCLAVHRELVALYRVVLALWCSYSTNASYLMIDPRQFLKAGLVFRESLI